MFIIFSSRIPNGAWVRRIGSMKTVRTITLLMALCALLPAATFVLSAAPLFAGDLDSYTFGGFSVGAQRLDISDLNSSLSANGYESFHDPISSWGLESYYVLNGRFVFGGELQYFRDKTSNTTYDQKLNGYWGFLNFGYNVVGKTPKGFHLYPLVGLGASRMGLRLTESTDLNFTDILADSKRESNLEKWDFLGQTALGIDYAFGSKWSGDDGGGGFMLGVRLGYQFSFTDSKWKMYEMDIHGDPEAGMSGFFVRVVFGGWGYGYDSDEGRDDARYE
jgi:hypothetical protein